MNKYIVKKELLREALSEIDTTYLEQAENFVIVRERPRGTGWMIAAACLALAAVAFFGLLFKKNGSTEQTALHPTPDAMHSISPDETETSQAPTPVPTPDIREKQIIYSDETPAISDDLPIPGTVYFRGSLNDMLGDERYRDCVFAVSIKIKCLNYGILNMHAEETEKLYQQMYADNPYIKLYDRLYQQFVEENSGRYYEYLAEYYFDPDQEHTEEDLELLAEKYDEDMVFPIAFAHYLDSIGQSSVYRNRRQALNEYYAKRHELWEDQQDRPEENAIVQSKYEKELHRLKDLGYIIEGVDHFDPLGDIIVRGLLTYDQLVDFPPDSEYAYIITLTGETTGITE